MFKITCKQILQVKFIRPHTPSPIIFVMHIIFFLAQMFHFYLNSISPPNLHVQTSHHQDQTSSITTATMNFHTCGRIVHLSAGPQSASQGTAILPHPEPDWLQCVGVPLALVPDKRWIKDTCVYSEEGHVGGRDGPLCQELHCLQGLVWWSLGEEDEERDILALYIQNSTSQVEQK